MSASDVRRVLLVDCAPMRHLAEPAKSRVGCPDRRESGHLVAFGLEVHPKLAQVNKLALAEDTANGCAVLVQLSRPTRLSTRCLMP